MKANGSILKSDMRRCLLNYRLIAIIILISFRKVSGNPRLFNCRDESVIHVRIRTPLFLNRAYLHS